MSLKKLIVCHFVLTAAPPDSIWLADAAIHRLGLLGESAAMMRKPKSVIRKSFLSFSNDRH